PRGDGGIPQGVRRRANEWTSGRVDEWKTGRADTSVGILLSSTRPLGHSAPLRLRPGRRPPPCLAGLRGALGAALARRRPLRREQRLRAEPPASQRLALPR